MKKKIIIILLTVLTTLLIVGCALQAMAMPIEDTYVEKTEKASHEEVNDTRNENNFINNRIKNSIKQRSLKFNHLINHEEILDEINKNVEIAIENLKEEIVVETVSYKEEVIQETYTQPVQESTYIKPEQEDPSSQEVIQETTIEEPQDTEVVEEIVEVIVEEVIEEPVEKETAEEYIAPTIQTYSIGIPGGTMKYYRGIDYNELCTNLQPLIDAGNIVKYNNYFAGHNPGAMGHLGSIGIGSPVRVSYGENDYYDYTIIDHAYASGASFADVYIGGTTLWDIMCTNSSSYIVIQFCVGGQNNFWLGQL